MKCGKCGETVTVQPGKSTNFCSNCGSKIEAITTSSWRFFDNTKDLLAHIANEYGYDVLFSKKNLSDHISPMMPQGQYKLVTESFSCGAVKILQDNMSENQKNKEIAVRQAIKKLTDLMFSKEAAERVIWEFTNAIGWGMAEPVGSTPHLPPQSQPQPKKNRATSTGYSAENFTKRGYICLRDSEWGKASGFFDNALNIDADYSPAYLGLICVDLKVSANDQLVIVKDPSEIIKHKYYRLAAADPAIKTQLDGYVQKINERIDAEQKAAAAEAERKRRAALRKRTQVIFDTAVTFMNKAQSSDDYHKAIAAFGRIDSSYSDINSQIESKIAEAELKCKAAEEAERRKRVQDAFDKAVELMNNAHSIDDYRKAIAAFGSIDSSYKDINSKIKSKFDKCETKIFIMEEDFKNKYGVLLNRLSVEGKAKAEQRRQAAQMKINEENKKAVEAKCEQIKQQHDGVHKAWQDECNRIKAAYDKAEVAAREQAEQWKSQGLCPYDGGKLKGLITTRCASCGRVPNEPIKTPISPIQPNYPVEPRMPLLPVYTPRSLGGIDPLANVVMSVKDECVFIRFSGIDWRVLTVENNKALLISEKILEKRAYSYKYTITTWNDCTLREYLNGLYLDKLGTVTSAIADTCNRNPNNPWYDISGGYATTDKIFLLSLDEVCRYFGDSTENLKTKQNTGFYNKINDANNNVRIAKYGNEDAWWWLRSPGGSVGSAAYVNIDGSLHIYGHNVDRTEGGVRPALLLNL